jgi:DNA-binding PadR family transcriptional regulator
MSCICLNHSEDKNSNKNHLTNYIRCGYSFFMFGKDKKTSLTPAVFHILLALSGGELHGYGIMKKAQEDSKGKVKMGAGTLYGSLKRMLDAKLISECDKRIDAELDDERRIYYQITGLGKKALSDELERYNSIINLAQELKLLSKKVSYEI